jgi:hypothetical protein
VQGQGQGGNQFGFLKLREGIASLFKKQTRTENPGAASKP